MIDQIKAIVKQQRTCVLATIAGNKPYCSLMAYATDNKCEQIYMVTHKNTRKYDNLMKNPAVSLMVDTREAKPQGQALTVEGSFYRIDNKNKQKQVRSRLLQIHPHLKEFLDHPEAELIGIKIHSFLLLSGLTDAHFIKIR